MPDRLQSPLRLPCGVTLPNRLAKAAMTERLARGDHLPNELHVALYRRWASQAGLLFSGNVMVDRRSLESAGNVVVDNAGVLPALRTWTEAATSQGALFFAQISHSGRQTSRFVNAHPVSASDVGLSDGLLYARPRSLSEGELHDIVERFAQTAALCQQGGFDGVEIHGAHGYLISQFLSPLTNQRRDQWGGSIANRARLLLSIVKATRQAVGRKFPIAVKLNSADFQKGGFSEEESLAVISMLEAEKIDLLEISGGNYESPRFLLQPTRESTRRREAYFLDFAEKVRRASRLKLMITGGFRTRAVAEEALASRAADVIGVARPFLVDADFGRRFLAEDPGSTRTMETHSPRGPGRRLSLIAEGGYWDLQIHRMARGLSPDLSAGVARSVSHILTKEMIKSVAHHLAGPTRERNSTRGTL